MSLIALALACLSCFILVTAVHDSSNNVLFNGNYEFIDLTYPFDNNTIYWPTTQKFVFTNKIEDYRNGMWYASKEFAAGEHGGTHLDAPYHFYPEGNHVGDLPLEKLIVPLIIVDISSKVNDDPNFVLYKHHLDHMLNDNFGKPCVIIFKFGWSKFFGDRNKYLGFNEVTKTMSFPGLSDEVAQWITSSYKNVVGIGVDTASTDAGSSTNFPVHQTTAKNGLYQLENVNLNQPVPEYGCTALVMPMKIMEGTGAPLRLVAICPKKIPTSFDSRNDF